jgi:hypothetical protein
MFIVATRSKCLPAAESDLGAEKIRFKRMTENFFVSLRGLTERLTWRPLSLARQAVPPPGIEGHWGIVQEQISRGRRSDAAESSPAVQNGACRG